jgi:DnaD/phage-associated family protein
VKGFAGFPAGRLRTTPVPNLFFAELLPAIDHLGELKVTLYCFWRLGLKEGAFRYVRRAEFLEDEALLRGLAPTRRDAEPALDDALERAAARGSLLHVSIESANGIEDLYFLNTAKGRAAVEALTRGEWRPSGDPEAPVDLLVERPNVFNLYEQNIGPLTPMIADELRDAEANYPAAWIEEGIRLAVTNNARSWRYVLAILERWRSEGKHDRDDRRDTEKYRQKYLDYLDE